MFPGYVTGTYSGYGGGCLTGKSNCISQLIIESSYFINSLYRCDGMIIRCHNDFRKNLILTKKNIDAGC